MKEKQVAVLLVQDVSVEEAARILGYPRSSVSSWSKQAEKLLEFKGPKTSKTLKGQGRKELFPGVAAIVTYMKDVRRDEKLLSTIAIIDRMWAENPQWVAENISSRKSGVLALECLCQRLANRHGFTSQKPQGAKIPHEELQVVRAEFALKFCGQYGQYQSGGILNVDETGINFEMPPHRAWALKDRQDPAHIVGLKKHPGRLTAVLTTRADGVMGPLKASIRGIFKGIRKGNLKTRRLRAIKATVAAWEALNTEVIKRSFEKAIPRYPEVMI
ncbi:hypothetical protein PC112_g13169 [Phytophthora cactorum]|nr:hypothetical protein PC112_g13169 [Phytophthora cactorum]